MPPTCSTPIRSARCRSRCWGRPCRRSRSARRGWRRCCWRHPEPGPGTCASLGRGRCTRPDSSRTRRHRGRTLEGHRSLVGREGEGRRRARHRSARPGVDRRVGGDRVHRPALGRRRPVGVAGGIGGADLERVRALAEPGVPGRAARERGAVEGALEGHRGLVGREGECRRRARHRSARPGVDRRVGGDRVDGPGARRGRGVGPRRARRPDLERVRALGEAGVPRRARPEAGAVERARERGWRLGGREGEGRGGAGHRSARPAVDRRVRHGGGDRGRGQQADRRYQDAGEQPSPGHHARSHRMPSADPNRGRRPRSSPRELPDQRGQALGLVLGDERA